MLGLCDRRWTHRACGDTLGAVDCGGGGGVAERGDEIGTSVQRAGAGH
jgi:hypothetical protein